jgi:hypothetical protein
MIKVVNGKQYNLVLTLAKALFVVNTLNNLHNNLVVAVQKVDNNLLEDAVVLVEDAVAHVEEQVVLTVMPLHVAQDAMQETMHKLI